MRREILYSISVDGLARMTKAQALEVDRQQPERERVSSWQMEDTCAMLALAQWAANISEKADMKDLTRKAGAYGLLRSGAAMLKKAFEKTASRISMVQIRSIDANLKNITLSTNDTVDGFCNVDVDSLQVLLQQTLSMCREKMCMQTEKDSLRCPVREALDNVLNAGRIRQNRTALMGGLCPYNLEKPEDMGI